MIGIIIPNWQNILRMYYIVVRTIVVVVEELKRHSKENPQSILTVVNRRSSTIGSIPKF